MAFFIGTAGAARLGAARRGAARLGKAGEARQGLVWHGVAGKAVSVLGSISLAPYITKVIKTNKEVAKWLPQNKQQRFQR